MSVEHFTIYTDGGCDPNPGPGGWAALIISGTKKKEISGWEAKSTNNRMELTAAINALNEIPMSSQATLYTDSQYVQKGIEEWMPKWLARNWRGTNGPVANRDLWEELLAVSRKHTVTWHWLRGHAGNRFNNRVDQLVGNAIKDYKTRADH